MENAVIKKDETIIKLELELEHLQRQITKQPKLTVDTTDNSTSLGQRTKTNSQMKTKNQRSGLKSNANSSMKITDKTNTILPERSNDLTQTNVSPPNKEPVQSKTILTSECKRSTDFNKSKILIIADSHGRNLARMFYDLNNFNFTTQVIFMPNATFQQVTQNLKDLAKNYTMNDHIFILAGTNNTNCSKHSLSKPSNISNVCVNDLINLSNQSNLYIFDVFARHDCVNCNLTVNKFNSLLKKESNNQLNFINISNILKIQDYTKQGLHVNNAGKRRLISVIKCCVTPYSKNFFLVTKELGLTVRIF